jgi:hypothetical protein
MSSSLTEHYGAITVLTVLVVLVIAHHDVETAQWPDTTLLIDNKEVVTRGNNLPPTFLNDFTYLMLGYDLWMVLVELQANLKFGIMFKWIKSHQCSSHTQPLTNEDAEMIEQKIRLNKDVDKLTTAAYTNDTEYVE